MDANFMEWVAGLMRVLADYEMKPYPEMRPFQAYFDSIDIKMESVIVGHVFSDDLGVWLYEATPVEGGRPR